MIFLSSSENLVHAKSFAVMVIDTACNFDPHENLLICYQALYLTWYTCLLL